MITGLISLVAAPAIVRAGSLMPVKLVSLRSVITPAEMGIDLYGRGPLMQLFDADFINREIVKIYRIPARWVVEQ